MIKNQKIETLRGFAIIVMVIGHVIGHTESTGLHVTNNSVWRYIYYSTDYFPMPLFTVIAGYVYALNPVQKENIFKFLNRKIQRIFLPLISVGTLDYIVRVFVPGTNADASFSEIWKIYFFSFAHYWFLQAIILVFFVIIVFELLGLLKNRRAWFVTLLMSSFFFLIVSKQIYFFSISKAFYLLPFFVLGCGLHNFKETIFNSKSIKIFVFILFIISIIVQQYIWLNKVWFYEVAFNVNRFSFLGLWVGLSGASFFILYAKEWEILAKIGSFSYTIYLFHVFGSAGTRIIFNQFGIESMMFHFPLGVLFALVFPIILEVYVLKGSMFRLMFLGVRKFDK